MLKHVSSSLITLKDTFLTWLCGMGFCKNYCLESSFWKSNKQIICHFSCIKSRLADKHADVVMGNSMLMWGEVNSKSNQLKTTIFECWCIWLYTAPVDSLVLLPLHSSPGDLQWMILTTFLLVMDSLHGTAKEVFTLDKYVVI